MVTDIPPVSTGADEKPRVLVVDDEYGPRESIAFTLSTEFEVETASRAKEALKKIGECEYAAVVMDIRMPVMNGVEATRTIRSTPSPYQNIAIVALTADASGENNAACLAAGADVFLTKPVIVSELFSSIRFARRKKLRSQDALSA